jgi:ABC-2 type transport system permease protein
MFLLILAAVPLESLAFMLGGVVVEELVLALIILLVTAFTFAVIGIFFSSLARTTLVSTVLTYAAALLTTVGVPVLLLASLLIEPLLYGYGSSTPSWIWEAALMYLLFFFAGTSPISAAVLTEVFLMEEDAVLYFWYELDSTHRILIPSAWIVYTVIYLALALVMLLVAVLRVRRQETR